jgi:hypothetical protein
MAAEIQTLIDMQLADNSYYRVLVIQETLAFFMKTRSGQPLYVEERNQIDAAITYRLNDQAAVFLELQNLTDETTRLHARHKEMLFLAQDHGLISRLGFRYKF